ncbi:MAG: hypothetical protein WC229_01020 [Candidatus Paceibacterota bacterium]|jgi:hypothetical protein
MGSFGTSSREEAIRRQETIRFFLENQKIRDWVIDNPFHTDDTGSHWQNGREFVNYFNPNNENKFWAEVGNICQMLTASAKEKNNGIPQEFQKFIGFLAEAREQIETPEKKMSRFVVSQLLKATKANGSVVARIYVDKNRSIAAHVKVVSGQISGHRLYSLNAPRAFSMGSSRWNKTFWKKIFVYNLVKYFALRRHEKAVNEWAKPVIIEKCPTEICEAVQRYINDNIFPNGKYPGFMDESSSEYDGDTGIDLYIRFAYGESGLKIQMVGLNQDTIQPPKGYGKRWNVATGEEHNIDMFRPDQIENMKELDREARRRAYLANLLTHFVPKFWGYTRKIRPALVSDDGVLIQDQNVDNLFKWHQASTLCMLDEWKDVYEQSKNIRSYARQNMSILCDIAYIASKFDEKSKEWGLPVTFPKILDGKEQIFSFKELWPVSLIGRKTSASKEKEITAKDLRPIKALGQIRGGISIMTGDNGAGKTTIGEELLGMLHDAASGLPIFGKDVELNLRNIIGTIFLERGDGSTMQLSLAKLAEVLKGVAEHPKNGTFVLWDEMGTGTTREEGLKLGMTCLKKFNNIGCTVLSNTQIPELAEAAQTMFGAKCFKVDRNHKIEPGIGTADIATLAKDMGIAKELGF